MFAFTFGDVGSGKSLAQADQTLLLLEQSVKIEKKYKLPKREIWTNAPMNKQITEKYKDRLRYWKNPLDMVFVDDQRKIIRTNFDCLWDEIAVEIPSDKWKETDPEIRRFFAQHRKRGIRIWANTQDYMMVDINARRMATHVYQVHKIIGSRDPSPTLPPLKKIWGMVFVWELDKAYIRQDDMDRRHLTLLPYVIFINKKLCLAYDTSYDISKEFLELRHIERECKVCGKVKVEHA